MKKYFLSLYFSLCFLEEEEVYSKIMCGSSGGFLWFFVCAWLLWSQIVTIHATTCFLNPQTGNDSTGNGTSIAPWASFFKAIDSACDDIYAQPGLYSGPNNRGLVLAIATNITGTGSVNIVNDGPDKGAIVDLQGQDRFLSSSAPLQITRLTIREGVTIMEGGAIQSSSSVFLELCSIHHNNVSGPPLALGTLRGGAIVASRLRAVHSSFRQNRIARGSTGSITIQGGALAADTVEFYNCSLRFNGIVKSGAGITASQGGALAIIKQTTTLVPPLIISNTIFYENTISGTGAAGLHTGAAVYFENPVDTPDRVSLQVQRGLFFSNRINIGVGTRTGGAIYSEVGDLSPVENSLFFHNYVGNQGGAIHINQFSSDRPSGLNGGSNQFVNNTADVSGGDIVDGGTVGINFSPPSTFQCSRESPVVDSTIGCTGCTLLSAVDTDQDGTCNSGDCAPLDPALQVVDTTGTCIPLSNLDSDTGLAPALQGMSFFLSSLEHVARL